MIERIINTLKSHDWLAGLLLTVGLILVMSDGALFPWGNLAGLGLIGLVAWMEG